MDRHDRSTEPGDSEWVHRSRTPEALHRLRLRYAGELLETLAAALTEAAAIYNQTAQTTLQVSGPHEESGRQTVELWLDQSGFRFEDTGCGVISVHDIDGGYGRPYARVQPLVTSAGNLAGWQEERVRGGEGTCAHTLESLVDQYLIAAVRRRLVAAAAVQ